MTAFNQLSWMGPYREGSRLQRCIITVASDGPFRATFQMKKSLISESQPTCTRFDSAANRGMSLSRSGVTIGETENDVTLGEEKSKINYCP